MRVYRVQGLGFRVYRVQGLGSKMSPTNPLKTRQTSEPLSPETCPSARPRMLREISGLGFRVYRVSGLGCRV